MTILMLTLALQTCERFANELQSGGGELYSYHDACILAVDADIPGTYQLSTCVREADGSVVCDWWTYGTRRLPYQPMVAR